MKAHIFLQQHPVICVLALKWGKKKKKKRFSVIYFGTRNEMRLIVGVGFAARVAREPRPRVHV